ncbi:TolC family outer membrane protein [Chitinibacteraceae bacterium HSL-7]
MKLKPLLLACALAQPALAHDLVEAVQAARQYDASYQAAAAAAVAGREKAVQGRALWLPKVDVTGGAKKIDQDFEPGRESVLNPSTSTNGERYDVGVEVRQPIYRAEVFVGAQQLSRQSDLAEVQFNAERESLILRVSRAYFEVLAAQERVALAAAQKEAVAQQLAYAKKAFEVGVSTITDTNEAQARYDAIVASEIAAQNDLDVKRNVYAQVTGLDGATLATIADGHTPAMPDPAALDTWVSRARESNRAVQAQALGLDIAKLDIDRYRTLTAPTLDLFGTYGRTWDASGLARAGGTDQTTSGVVGLQLSIPVFTGGDRSSKYREAIATRDQEAATLESVRRDSEQMAKQAYLGVQSGVAQIAALEQAQKSAWSSLESTKLGREVGVRTTIDVLDAEQKFYQSRYELIVARYTYLYARLQLAYAAGELGDDDVEGVNTWLH